MLKRSIVWGEIYFTPNRPLYYTTSLLRISLPVATFTFANLPTTTWEFLGSAQVRPIYLLLLLLLLIIVIIASMVSVCCTNAGVTPDLPTNITPTNIAWLRLSRKFPMDLGIPPLIIKIMLESNPLKSIMLVRRLAVGRQECWNIGFPYRKSLCPVVVRSYLRSSEFKGVPRNGVWISVNMRVWTCKESRVNHFCESLSL